MIASRFRRVTPRAGPLVVTASSSPYIDASRAPSPDGKKTTSTATIAPTAETPPRNGIVDEPGVAAEAAQQEVDPEPADQPRAAVEEEQQHRERERQRLDRLGAERAQQLLGERPEHARVEERGEHDARRG